MLGLRVLVCGAMAVPRATESACPGIRAVRSALGSDLFPLVRRGAAERTLITFYRAAAALYSTPARTAPGYLYKLAAALGALRGDRG